MALSISAIIRFSLHNSINKSIIPENRDQIREIKNFDEFSSLFEFLLERAESSIQGKTTEKVDSLQAPATSHKCRQVYEHKPLVTGPGQKPCEPQFSKHSNLESGGPVIHLVSESRVVHNKIILRFGNRSTN